MLNYVRNCMGVQLDYVKNRLGMVDRKEVDNTYINVDFTCLMNWLNESNYSYYTKTLAFNVKKDKVIELLNTIIRERITTDMIKYDQFRPLLVKYDTFFYNANIDDGLKLYQLIIFFGKLPAGGEFRIVDDQWIKYVHFTNSSRHVNASLTRTNINYVPICSFNEYVIPRNLLNSIKKQAEEPKKYCTMDTHPENDDYTDRIKDLVGLQNPINDNEPKYTCHKNIGTNISEKDAGVQIVGSISNKFDDMVLEPLIIRDLLNTAHC